MGARRGNRIPRGTCSSSGLASPTCSPWNRWDGARLRGLRLVARLIAAGWKVVGLALPGDPLARKLEFLGCEVRKADVRDPASLLGAFDGIDTVYHLAAVIVSHDPAVFGSVNRDGTAN